MKPYPLADELLRLVLRVAMPHAVASTAFLTRYLPPRRRRVLPVLREFTHLEAKRRPVPYSRWCPLLAEFQES